MTHNCFDTMRKKRPNPAIDAASQKWYQTIAASVGWYWTPRVKDRSDYPLDLDWGERIVRPSRGTDYFPVPGLQLLAAGGDQFMGYCNNTMPMNDVAMIEIAMQKRATPGPYLYSDDYVGSFTAVPLAGAPKLA
jgi:hypothetical protein